mmetsp:Transcript_9323/g.17511  ORF Transcript_9323/g.17511 Transcript_9323/m.17511 type:complete len:83 (+) Transcript_9323:233-481(+)
MWCRCLQALAQRSTDLSLFASWSCHLPALHSPCTTLGAAVFDDKKKPLCVAETTGTGECPIVTSFGKYSTAVGVAFVQALTW